MKQSDAQGRLSGIQGTKAKEPDLERMMDGYGSALLRLCYMYLGDRQLAEDAVQETFLKVYKKYALFDGGDEKAWVIRIAVNVCRDVLRGGWRRRVTLTDETPEPPAAQGPGAGGTGGPDARDSADDSLVREVMRLKPKYKEVILLFYYRDMKIADIAKALGAPESTVSVRLKRAREILKTRLGGWYYGEE